MAIDCNQLKITIERFYQLTGTYNSFESVLYLKTYEIHIYKQKYEHNSNAVRAALVKARITAG